MSKNKLILLIPAASASEWTMMLSEDGNTFSYILKLPGRLRPETVRKKQYVTGRELFAGQAVNILPALNDGHI